MSFLKAWSHWSVQKFLDGENWQGAKRKNSDAVLTVAPPVIHSVSETALRKQSWTSLAVGDFLELGNWTGQKEVREHFAIASLRPLGIAPEVKGIVLGSSWSSLQVGEFLKHSNWEGKRQSTPVIPLEASAIPAPVRKVQPLTNRWVNASVQEFFEQANWQGRYRPPVQTVPGNVAPHPLELDLHLSVQDFMNNIIWEGKPEIGALPPDEPESNFEAFTTPAQEATVDDLFDLF
jgi:hypothetical protein